MKAIKQIKRIFKNTISGKVLVACLAIGGVLALGAVLHNIKHVRASTPTNANNRATVVFVGDSNITLSSYQIDIGLTTQAHDDDSYNVVLQSRVGSGIRTADCVNQTTCTTYNYWGIKLPQVFSKIQPDAIVSDLGINDTTTAGTASTQGYAYYIQKIGYMMNLFPAGKPVFWTNLPCYIEPSDRLTGCQTVNYALNQAAKQWSNLTVLDWSSVANTHPEYINGPVGSTVHLSNAGQAAWVQLVVNALDARFQANY